MEEAEAQLRGYMASDEWRGMGNLRAYTAVFVYDKLYGLKEVKNEK